MAAAQVVAPVVGNRANSPMTKASRAFWPGSFCCFDLCSDQVCWDIDGLDQGP
jgi:hypothetical protein